MMIYTLVYRSAITGHLTGEVSESQEYLENVALTTKNLMKGGHYTIYCADFKEGL